MVCMFSSRRVHCHLYIIDMLCSRTSESSRMLRFFPRYLQIPDACLIPPRHKSPGSSLHPQYAIMTLLRRLNSCAFIIVHRSPMLIKSLDQRRIHLRRNDGLPPFIPQIYPTALCTSHHGLQVPLRGQDGQNPHPWPKS